MNDEKPSPDAQGGIDWWNSLTDQARAFWLRECGGGSASAADAWALFKIAKCKHTGLPLRTCTCHAHARNKNKQLTIRTKHHVEGTIKWLRALDPLDVGRASFVRSEWVNRDSDATIFTSRMYADEVAANNPGRRAFVVVPVK
jgi:hypothetical protein